MWLLEELDVPYKIKSYKRDPKTRLAPASLSACTRWASRR